MKRALAWLLLGIPTLALAGENQSISNLDLKDSLEALNFDQTARRDIHERPQGLDHGKKLVDRLADLNLKTTAYRTERRQKGKTPAPRRQPYRHFMPALGGMTGLIDMPVAYTQPKRTWVVSAMADRLRADSEYWPLPYRSIEGDSTYYSVNYGARDDVELTLTGEFWDKDVQYADATFGTLPRFTTKDQFFLGAGMKYSFPVEYHDLGERMWIGLGARFQLFDNQDRNVTEIHEYDRFSTVYLTASTKGTETLFGHFTYKYISYDFKGGRFPSGATGAFPGYSPTNAWAQLGLAVEWFMFPDVVVFTELVQDTNVIFAGTLNQFNWNAGVRYQLKDFGVGFWAKRINLPGLSQSGVQASVRF